MATIEIPIRNRRLALVHRAAARGSSWTSRHIAATATPVYAVSPTTTSVEACATSPSRHADEQHAGDDEGGDRSSD